MKKNVYLAALMAGAALTACNGQASKYQISGHLDGVESDTLIVFVQAQNLTRTERVDTIAMKGGDFAFNVADEGVRPIYILAKPVRGAEDEANGSNIPVLAIAGEQCVINGTLDDYTLSGSPFFEEYEVYRQSDMLPMQQQLNDLQAQRKARLEAGEDEETVNADFMDKANALVDQWSESGMNYIKEHPDSDVSAYIAATLGDRFEEAMALLTDRAKQGIIAPYIQAIDNMMEAQKVRQQAAEQIQPGNEAPDFTLTDLGGNPLTLSSLRGKYLVLDFWGSWCVWCIKGIPDMKEYYEKYKDKMEILSIACRDSEEQWKAAVEKYELPWLHVINADDNDVSALYAIQGYPTKVIVDPEGKIAHVVVGEDPAFYQYLDSLFK
ncbi:MAG: AhpC/TSA family protein [Prevotellaceae bacterium]|nr:AhpC/TSA family protein [Prevotellaceae bacterium]